MTSRLGALDTNRVAKSTSAHHASQASATIWGCGTAPSKSPSRSVPEQNSRGTSWPAIIARNVARSASARCRSSPSSDIVDGSTERRAIALASRPEHFISTVRRRQRRHSACMTRSSPSLRRCSRGSSSDGLPSAVNISARRVVAMAATIGHAHHGHNRLKTPALMASGTVGRGHAFWSPWMMPGYGSPAASRRRATFRSS